MTKSTRREFVLKVSRATASIKGAALLSAAGTITKNSEAANPSISLITPSSSPQLLHGWGGNTQYKAQLGPYAYGTWADGPLNPYRRSSGDAIVRAIVPQSENRTQYFVPGIMQYPGFSPLTPMTFESVRDPNLANADHSHWIFSVFNINSDGAIGLAHTESYSRTFDEYGKNWSGRNKQDLFPDYQETYGISLFKTLPRSDVHDQFTYGFTPIDFNGVPATHAEKLSVLRPAPHSFGGFLDVNGWGFACPSNMIEDGSYVYAFVQHRPATQHSSLINFWEPPATLYGKAGPVLIRCQKSLVTATGNPANANGPYWEIFSESGAWVYIGRYAWADASIANAPIRPYVFFRNVYPAGWQNGWAIGMGLIQGVRKVGGKFVTIGSMAGSMLYFSYCSSLSAPLELESYIQQFGLPNNNYQDGAFNLNGARYISFFDPYDADVNYQFVEQNTDRVMLVTAKNLESYVAFKISFSGF